MKFRKRPVIVDAVQFFAERPPWPDGVKQVAMWPGYPGERTLFEIDTLEGAHFVTDGDWIITGVKGERYPCKPDIFALTYEEVTA